MSSVCKRHGQREEKRLQSYEIKVREAKEESKRDIVDRTRDSIGEFIGGRFRLKGKNGE